MQSFVIKLPAGTTLSEIYLQQVTSLNIGVVPFGGLKGIEPGTI